MAHQPAYVSHMQRATDRREQSLTDLALPDIGDRRRLELQRDHNQAIADVEYYIRKGVNAPNPRQTIAEKLRNARLIVRNLDGHLPGLETDLAQHDRAIAEGDGNWERERKVKYDDITEAQKELAYARADVVYYEGRVALEGGNVDVQAQHDGNVANLGDLQIVDQRLPDNE